MRRLAQAVFGPFAQLGGAARWARLRWMLRRWLHFGGKPGVLAVGILLVYPVFYLAAIVPARERLDVAQRNAQARHEQIRRANEATGSVRHTPAEQLAEFYRIFPEERSAPKWLGKLAVLAQENGIVLNEGDYKVMRDDSARLMRLQMVLPVKGEYQTIRRFLAALPAEIPVIALENVQFSRHNVGDPSVEALIRLTLYLEQAS